MVGGGCVARFYDGGVGPACAPTGVFAAAGAGRAEAGRAAGRGGGGAFPHVFATHVAKKGRRCGARCASGSPKPFLHAPAGPTAVTSSRATPTSLSRAHSIRNACDSCSGNMEAQRQTLLDAERMPSMGPGNAATAPPPAALRVFALGGCSNHPGSPPLLAPMLAQHPLLCPPLQTTLVVNPYAVCAAGGAPPSRVVRANARGGGGGGCTPRARGAQGEPRLAPTRLASGPFKCLEVNCSFQSAWQQCLARHAREKHLSLGRAAPARVRHRAPPITSHPCLLGPCGYTAKTRTLLVRHQLLHDNGAGEKVAALRCRAPGCVFSAAQHADLLAHARWHSARGGWQGQSSSATLAAEE